MLALHHCYFLEYTSDFGLSICSASLLPVLQQCFSSTWTVAVLHLYLDFPEYNMATAASGAATASLDQQSTRDSYIPIFDGTLAGYKEWRKRITIYAKKMELTNRKNECVLNLLGSSQGTAWKLVEDFDVEKAKEETAFKAYCLCWILHSSTTARSSCLRTSPPTSKLLVAGAARPCCSTSLTMMNVFAAWRSMV